MNYDSTIFGQCATHEKQGQNSLSPSKLMVLDVRSNGSQCYIRELLASVPNKELHHFPMLIKKFLNKVFPNTLVAPNMARRVGSADSHSPFGLGIQDCVHHCHDPN